MNRKDWEDVEALPNAWPAGEVTGLRARGGFEIDLKWKMGQFHRARVRRLLGLGRSPVASWRQNAGPQRAQNGSVLSFTVFLCLVLAKFQFPSLSQHTSGTLAGC